MAMSRKNYQATADILAGERALALNGAESDGEQTRMQHRAKLDTIRNIMFSMADMFAQDNPRFDRDKFYSACGFDMEHAN